MPDVRRRARRTASTVTPMTSPGSAMPVSASDAAGAFAIGTPLRVHAYANVTASPSASAPSAIAVSVEVGQSAAVLLESSTVAVGAVLARPHLQRERRRSYRTRPTHLDLARERAGDVHDMVDGGMRLTSSSPVGDRGSAPEATGLPPGIAADSPERPRSRRFAVRRSRRRRSSAPAGRRVRAATASPGIAQRGRGRPAVGRWPRPVSIATLPAASTACTIHRTGPAAPMSATHARPARTSIGPVGCSPAAAHRLDEQQHRRCRLRSSAYTVKFLARAAGRQRLG